MGIPRSRRLRGIGSTGEVNGLNRVTFVTLSKARQISVFICLIDTGKWTGEKLRQLGSLVKGLDTSDIKKLGKEAFEEAVGIWGKYLDVDVETLEALADKAKEVSSFLLFCIGFVFFFII